MILINILIVDDQKTIRLLLANILNRMGYKSIDFAASGEETFAIVEEKLKKGETIDLILLDINLPDDNGINVCERLKKEKRLADTPIVMITGNEESTTLKKAFSAGAEDYITKMSSKIELQSRIASALRLRKEIKKRNAREKELRRTAKKLKAANKKLEEMASQDGLTGLSNRRLFDKTIRKEWKKAQENESNLGVIMLDIDHFKEYNDYYGHQTGDDCLKDLAAVMKELTPGPENLAARYGGEEFVIVLVETDLAKVKAMAKRLREKIVSLKIAHQESKVADYVTVSIGAAMAQPDHKSGAKRLIKKADEMLYQAKEEGRNQVKIAASIIE